MLHLLMNCYMVFFLYEFTSHQAIMNYYIQQALEHNLTLKQHHCSYLQSLESLNQTRAALLPTLRLEARYSRAGGGRTIDMPISDLLNPVHQALNQLLEAQGQTASFPADIEDERIYFLRPKEHDTKLSLDFPLFYPELWYQVKAKREMAHMADLGMLSYRCQLVADIQVAYYTYQKTLHLKTFLQNTRELLLENLRVCQSLYDNHKRTMEVVWRAKAELSELEGQIAETGRDVMRAAAYFNFLLNRSLRAEIINSRIPEPIYQDLDSKALEEHALCERLDYQQLRAGFRAAELRQKSASCCYLPSLVSSFQYGFQGEQYRFKGEDDYWSASLLMRWTIYAGGGQRARKQQAKWQKTTLQLQVAELAKKICLQVQTCSQGFQVSQKKMKACLDRKISRFEAFRIVAKKYEQGLVPQVEYIKARNNYTNSGIEHILALFDVYIRRVELVQVARLDGNKWLPKKEALLLSRKDHMTQVTSPKQEGEE